MEFKNGAGLTSTSLQTTFVSRSLVSISKGGRTSTTRPFCSTWIFRKMLQLSSIWTLCKTLSTTSCSDKLKKCVVLTTPQIFRKMKIKTKVLKL